MDILDDEGNLIGGPLLRMRQRYAIEALQDGYKVEALRASQGFVWLSKGNISKQVNPNKVSLLLFEGWHLTKISED